MVIEVSVRLVTVKFRGAPLGPVNFQIHSQAYISYIPIHTPSAAKQETYDLVASSQLSVGCMDQDQL